MHDTRTREERLQAARDALAKRQAEAVAAHNARVQVRVPLYAATIGALRAAVVAGDDPKTCWVKEFSPLTPEERRVVRQRFLEQLEQGARQ